jgi:imidazolonepropionase-like amidohydrolase
MRARVRIGIPERLVLGVGIMVALWISPAAAQTYDTLTPQVREFVSVGAPLIALTHVQLIDGTGSAPAQDQTVVIRDGRVEAVGRSGSVPIPSGADVHDLTGHTVIPGLVGLHNHTFYRGVRGTPGETTAQLDVSSPRLYLASGVTTIRTTGSISPYSELNVKHQIDSGEAPGPRMYVTGPYFDGEGAPVSRYQPASPEDAKRVVRYWVEEGVTWFKAYANIKGENLKAIIDEAHRLGAKVTGHLCSVSFGEAMELEIDNLEHGFLTASDFEVDKPQDVCPPGFIRRLADVDIEGPQAQDLIQDLIRSGTPITSTLSAYEFGFVPGGRPIEDRVLEMMPTELAEWYVVAHQALIDREREFRADPGVGEDDPWPFAQVFRNAQAFERSFVEQGGLLVAGTDPCCPVLPGFGDQRNFELLSASGFSPVQVVQIMAANGARVLDGQDSFGTVTPGKLADLVVIEGDLTSDPVVIQNVRIVFKEGVGFDPEKLLASVRGMVGLR